MPLAPGDIVFADDLDRCGVVARRVAVQAVTTAVATDISWDTEDYDSDNLFTPPSPTITIPFAGIYSITVRIDNSLSGATATGSIYQEIAISSAFSGASLNFRTSTPSGDWAGLVNATQRLLAGDTFKVSVFHQSGANRSYIGQLQCWRVSA